MTPSTKLVGSSPPSRAGTLYVGGNGGFTPRHAELLASDLDTETLVQLIDRYLMFYVRTADRLQRTAPWIESLEGGLEHTRWEVACAYDRLLPERGVAALFEVTQVAVFRLHDGTVHAVGNVDPFSGAAVLSRGIVGDRGGVPTVASPIYKQVFSLVDGRCLDDPAVGLVSYPVRVSDGSVLVGIPWAAP